MVTFALFYLLEVSQAHPQVQETFGEDAYQRICGLILNHQSWKKPHDQEETSLW